MKILVTGSEGFIGRNLVCRLREAGHEVYRYDINTGEAALAEFCRECEFVYNLAGVNRPRSEDEFMQGNFSFASALLASLEAVDNRCPVMLSSSTQAALDNPYGKSKAAGEALVREYGDRRGVPVYIFRFPNVFGKWCRPDYNSATATFCHNIARGIPITVNNPDTQLTLVYIDDVCDSLIALLRGECCMHDTFCTVPVTYKKTLGEITALLYSFRDSRADLGVCDMSDAFAKCLYSTYLSYLPKEGFSYPLKMNRDSRGSFTEIIRTPDRGQFSVNIAKPGIVKGNHYHHTKTEKFLVVSGRGVIRLRKIDEEGVTEYHVSGDEAVVVDIPTGYTHNIENLGEDDMVTFMWANELYDPEHPDTFYEKV